MKKILSIFFIIFIFVGIYFYSSYESFKNDVILKDEILITINKGDSPLVLSDKLGVSELYLKIYLKNNPFPEFQEGTFKIEVNSDINDVFESLKHPIYDEAMITILEGWNIYDIDKCLSDPKYFLDINGKGCIYKKEDENKIYLDTPIIKSGEYINYVTNSEKIKALSSEVEPPFTFLSGAVTLEGFLYPDTYKIDLSNFKINKFVIEQLNNFEEKVINQIEKKYSPEKWQEIVNLASIVEKEEKNPNEKSTVAGILKKRLNENWFIGADITVCYPHELTSEDCKMVVSKYIDEKNEYNTRTMIGLPKTPIGNPSFATIYATINSKNSPYYFYLHDTKTGQIYYGVNNTEHEENKRKYLK